MHFDLAVVVDKPQAPKFVHESAHARAGRTDHFGQRLLADFRQDRVGRPLLAEIREYQQRTRETLLARIEQLIDQVLFGAAVTRQQVRDEQFGKPRVAGG